MMSISTHSMNWESPVSGTGIFEGFGLIDIETIFEWDVFGDSASILPIIDDDEESDQIQDEDSYESRQEARRKIDEKQNAAFLRRERTLDEKRERAKRVIQARKNVVLKKKEMTDELQKKDAEWKKREERAIIMKEQLIKTIRDKAGEAVKFVMARHDRQREEEKEERERRERENEKKREESDKRRSAREKKMKERFKSVVDNAFHVKQKKEQVDEEQKQRQLERITEKLQQAESRKKTQQQNKIRFASLEIKKVELISSPKRQQEYRKKSSRIRPPPPSKSRSHYDNSSSSLPSHSHGHSTHKSYPQYTKTLVTSFQYASALSYSMVMSYFTTVFANQDLMQSQGGSIPLISKENL
ncbi:hypothetical protein ADUPG1_000196 [Aduncisulcus paluster]|uniref:Uncharacterized protein n=1 Tax=Aduncisulcus paluster TaxID=2918883 RepID=A0ABQ5K5F4_9EUKA|nr:hypothetical protein ADUPG1_000196 [Aduncisulcus paluster]